MRAHGEVVLTGNWLYDGLVPSRIVVRTSDVAFGSGDADDPDDVREDRKTPCFYVGWYHSTDLNDVVSESGPFSTLREAILSVHTASRGSIKWSQIPASSDTIGVATHTLALRPLNGLRHLPHQGTAGWYIWGGEQLSDNPDFFQPVHFAHLPEVCPDVVDYLALAPGFRFLIDDGHEDVWNDPTIVHA